MKRKSLHASPCPIARALDSIGDWWTLLILRDVAKDVRRFNAIQKNLGIPRNILTTRLRMLVDREVLAIAPASDGSVYREYVLTAKGRDLLPVLAALREWGDKHAPALAECDAAVKPVMTAREADALDDPAGVMAGVLARPALLHTDTQRVLARAEPGLY
ncbi:hypothetical protein CAL14_05710 [Bordetella genomosp. 9]|uniref:winged helix-turn-helix transcriptional regulator n=1 Tax=Bordetella genomosp. 9 TaxID=1416803 RepID=UPI000A292A27|nr:helix-turn-helix domain-containing protein [Bordetella genomosp. 9]ARP89848.1 hypothetical protein CAL14_05710 [Bordetella genomosp. 9]